MQNVAIPAATAARRAVVGEVAGVAAPVAAVRRAVVWAVSGVVAPVAAVRRAVVWAVSGVVAPAAAARRAVVSGVSGMVAPRTVASVPVPVAAGIEPSETANPRSAFSRGAHAAMQPHADAGRARARPTPTGAPGDGPQWQCGKRAPAVDRRRRSDPGADCSSRGGVAPGSAQTPAFGAGWLPARSNH